MTWEAYHFGGELAPRMDLLEPDGTIANSITFDNVAEGALKPSIDMGPKMEATHTRDYELRKLIDGRRQPIKGGFYYEARLRFPILDLIHAGYVVSIVNHCMKAGNYIVDFYPYSDVTNIHFETFITGDVTDFNESPRPLAIGHSCTLEVYGLVPQAERPFSAPEGMICLGKGVVYPPAETVNSQNGSKGIVYLAAEMEDDLGYVLNTENAIV